MKKRLFMIALCIFCSVTVAYMYTKSDVASILSAQSAPAFQLPKGSKVVLGKYNNKEIVWDLSNDNNGYELMISKPIASLSTFTPSCLVATSPVMNLSNRKNYCLKNFDTSSTLIFAILYGPVTSHRAEVAKIPLNTLGVKEREDDL